MDIAIDAPDIETVKGMSGLKINPAVAVMQYSARIKTEAVLKVWLLQCVESDSERVLKKPAQDRNGRCQTRA